MRRKAKVIKIKQSCGGQGCKIEKYILPKMKKAA